MHSQQDLVNCAARISEEGRLLLILGRSLTRAVENPDGLSSWAIQRLENSTNWRRKPCLSLPELWRRSRRLALLLRWWRRAPRS